MDRGKLEYLERTVLEMVVRALTDYRTQAETIFREETDKPQDIAEDVTREAMEAMGMSGLGDRLYGKVDFKKAIYAFLPEPHCAALMLDAKAEKPDGQNTATIQMSQTSMRVKMVRQGKHTDVPGLLEPVIRRADREFQVVTAVAKYIYSEDGGMRSLQRIIVACIPNGRLQQHYNADVHDTIWLAGRDAPSLGEDFRVRLSFRLLRNKAPWRVREINFSTSEQPKQAS